MTGDPGLAIIHHTVNERENKISIAILMIVVTGIMVLFSALGIVLVTVLSGQAAVEEYDSSKDTTI